MPRNISENGKRFTAAWEQFRGTAYKATPAEKYWTIGYGHYGADVKPTDTITPDAALALLDKDMAATVGAVDRVASQSLTQAQFDAVVDLVFNAGVGVTFSNTGTGQALRSGDAAALRARLALFVNQRVNGVLTPVLGLRRRSASRLALFDGKSWREAEKIGRAVN